MADFFTHIILADEVLKRIESRRISEGIVKTRSLYLLGAQGPDPLYFYKCFPCSGNGALTGLAKEMHGEKAGAFLFRGFSRLQDVSYDSDWMNMAVYLCGFVCHLTLDGLIHPYVNWATDQWIWGVDGTPRSVTHMQVEMSLDVMLWKEKSGRPAYREKTLRLVSIGKRWPKSVSDFLMEAIWDVFGIKLSEKELNKVLRDYYRGHGLLYDPNGWKKALLSWLESFTGGGIRVPRHPYPVEPDNTIDWANRKKRTWVYPSAEGESHVSSVDEILEEAAVSAAALINTVFKRIFQKENIDDLFPV